MKRRIPGLHEIQSTDAPLKGLFLARVEWASHRWHLQRPYLSVRFIVLEPKTFQNRSFSGRFYSTERALWRLNWFLRDFGYDPELLAQDQVDEKALINLRGIVRTTYITLMGRTYQNLEAFAPATDWDELYSEKKGPHSEGNTDGL